MVLSLALSLGLAAGAAVGAQQLRQARDELADARRQREAAQARQADLLRHDREALLLTMTAWEQHRLQRDAAGERVRRWLDEAWRAARTAGDREELAAARVHVEAYLAHARPGVLADLGPLAAYGRRQRPLEDALQALRGLERRYEARAAAWERAGALWERELRTAALALPILLLGALVLVLRREGAPLA